MPDPRRNPHVSAAQVTSAAPSVRADLLAQAVVAILDLPAPTTREVRHDALRSMVDQECTLPARDPLVRALDARIEALCRMNGSAVFRALIDTRRHQAMAEAVVVAASAPVVSNGTDFEFQREPFVSELLSRLPAAGAA